MSRRNYRGNDSPSLVGRGSAGGRGQRRRSMSRHRARQDASGPRSEAGGKARQGNGTTDAHRWSESGMAIYGDRRKINPGDRRRTNPGEPRRSGGPCPIGVYRCIGGSKFLFGREALPAAGGVGHHHRQNPCTVGMGPPNQGTRRRDKTRMHHEAHCQAPTPHRASPRAARVRYAAQQARLNANAEGIHAEHANGPGAGAAFHSRHGTTEPGSPRGGGCCLRGRSGTIESIGAGHSSLCHGRAWSGHRASASVPCQEGASPSSAYRPSLKLKVTASS